MSTTSAEIDRLLQSFGFASGAASGRRAGQNESPSIQASERHFQTEVQTTSKAIDDQQSNTQSANVQNGAPPRFVPVAPDRLIDSGLNFTEVSDLILKSLNLRGLETGFNLARFSGLKFPLIEGVLRQLKVDRLVTYKNSTAGGDYVYELTDLGRERTRSLLQTCSYLGTAPVPLDKYILSVKAQSLEGRKPPLASIREAFKDLEMNEAILSKVGQAIHSGRGMFLYGAAGNGKTSIAERITRSFGDSIWIPKAIIAAGEIIRVFDPNRHKPVPVGGSDPDVVDGRWVQIERPTVVVGGELGMDNLEVTYMRRAGVGEAPLQLKANCGTLLIDDLGRQQMSIDQLLNRWIVPLEQRHDYLHLESGRTIQVPFDQLIIFSSNLEPKDLVDEAFLRRIPYKIEIINPVESEFRTLFTKVAEKLAFTLESGSIDYLVQKHYIASGREFRYCHSRDLLRQMENRCTLHGYPRVVNQESIDEAVSNYFAIM
ncbi:AAA family ATPase [Planctomicrobium sp. SH668]|uniref:AAA family ATPase n=1 Tax=Planctomicrobium sp. SH668 TaxID=3448126 RepID=UPI003F5B2C5D